MRRDPFVGAPLVGAHGRVADGAAKRAATRAAPKTIYGGRACPGYLHFGRTALSPNGKICNHRGNSFVNETN
jgi:hypothetical protein